MTYDLHTHSELSDGRDRVRDMVRAAEAAGLTAVAITDHLEVNQFGGVDAEWVGSLLREVEAARSQSRVMVLAGVESSILDWKGRISVTPDLYSRLDLILAGIGWGTKGIGFYQPEDKTKAIRRLVDVYCLLATNPWVDVIAHPFNIGLFFKDLNLSEIPLTAVAEVASAFREGGVAFELNNSFWWWFPHRSPTEVREDYQRIVEIFADNGVSFVAGSDAHSFHGVGQLSWVRRLVQRVGLREQDFLSLSALRTRRFHRLR
ncbi:MAG: PHP domain-containing protein [Armatimonadetes bacterium]|nr:PHP domain-containing protein [Armatimonadota bacterium]MDW8122553.1 PHP domain-containing protein [Armatimonadota bacterium]